jgi:hypothetical protein
MNKNDSYSEIIQNCYRELERKKNDLVKNKLIEKGFGYLIDDMEKRRFPKVCSVKQGGWTFYYADNDTDEGAFIVAIEDYKIVNDPKEFMAMKVNFQWQDKHPIVYVTKEF